jgi:hypothetical protein
MWCFVIRVSSGVGGSPSFRCYVGVTIRSLLASQLHWLQGGIRESLEMAFGVENRVCWDFFSFPLPYRLSVGTASADLHSGVLAFLAEPYTVATREPGCQAIVRIRLCRCTCNCIFIRDKRHRPTERGTLGHSYDVNCFTFDLLPNPRSIFPFPIMRLCAECVWEC